MAQKHRVRISGQTRCEYDQIIELTDEELDGFRKGLDVAKNKGDQAINIFLGEDFGDGDPIDYEYDEWSAELIDDNGSVIEHLDYID